MGWFRRSRGPSYGYEDRAALKGFGGYEPAEPTPRTFGVSPQAPAQPERSSYEEPVASPDAPADEPRTPARSRVSFRRPLFGLGAVVAFGVLYVVGGVSGNSGQEATSAGAPAHAPVAPLPETRVVVPAAVSGWQPVVRTDGGYAYDVPPDWVPEPGMVHGWESGGSRFALVTSALVGEGFCDRDENVQRGGSGMTTAPGDDAAAAAVATVEELARRAFTPDGGAEPTVELVEQRSVEVPIGERDREATLVFAEVTVADPGEQCLPRRALVGALAVAAPSGESTPVLVAYDGQDGPGVTSEDDMTRLLTSLRTVPESERETTVVTPTP